MSLFSWLSNLFKKDNMIDISPKEEEQENTFTITNKTDNASRLIVDPNPPSFVVEEEEKPAKPDLDPMYKEKIYGIYVDTYCDHRFLDYKEIGATSRYFEFSTLNDEGRPFEKFKIYVKKMYKGVHLVPFSNEYLNTLFYNWEDNGSEANNHFFTGSFACIYDHIVGYHLFTSKVFNSTDPTIIHKIDFSIPYPTDFDPNNCITGFVLIDKDALDKYNRTYRDFIMKIIREKFLDKE